MQGRSNIEMWLGIRERGVALPQAGCVSANADRRRAIRPRSGEGDLDTERPVARLHAGDAQHAIPWTRMAWQ
jgi:hypothetical protein